jgi:hypothetical protein
LPEQTTGELRQSASPSHQKATMSCQELRDWVAETRARQGLQPTINDPATLARVAMLVADTMTVARRDDAAGSDGVPATIKRAS